MARTKTQNKQELSFATLILEHPALEAIQDRVAQQMLQRFRRGSKEEREIINAMLDNDVAFLSVLKAIVAENTNIKK